MQRFINGVGIFFDRIDNYGRIGLYFKNFRDSLQPIHSRHNDVEYHNVGFSALSKKTDRFVDEEPTMVVVELVDNVPHHYRQLFIIFDHHDVLQMEACFG